jgi:hypothetical protein
MLSTGNAIFFKPKSEAVQAEQARKNFFRPGGDHMSLLAVWDAVSLTHSMCVIHFQKATTKQYAPKKVG